MIHIIIGSLILSIIHASIPNHWIPLVLISKAEKWNSRETMAVTAITAFSHTLSTIILGILIGLIGYKLSESYQAITQIIASLVLIFMGLVYFALDMKHSHHEHLPDDAGLPKKSKLAIILTLCMAMFFSPCLEIETIYFSAGTLGWIAIAAISAIYLIVTVSGIVILVALGCKSIEKFNWHFLEHHEKKITGGVLIALGILSFFLKL
jgi:sulfite exporter TauE/SafE